MKIAQIMEKCHGGLSKANGFAKEIAIFLARSRGASVGTTPEGMFDLPFCAMTQKTQSTNFFTLARRGDADRNQKCPQPR